MQGLACSTNLARVRLDRKRTHAQRRMCGPLQCRIPNLASSLELTRCLQRRDATAILVQAFPKQSDITCASWSTRNSHVSQGHGLGCGVVRRYIEETDKVPVSCCFCFRMSCRYELCMASRVPTLVFDASARNPEDGSC